MSLSESLNPALVFQMCISSPSVSPSPLLSGLFASQQNASSWSDNPSPSASAAGTSVVAVAGWPSVGGDPGGAGGIGGAVDSVVGPLAIDAAPGIASTVVCGATLVRPADPPQAAPAPRAQDRHRNNNRPFRGRTVLPIWSAPSSRITPQVWR